MRRLLLAVGLPVAGTGALVGAAYGAQSRGWIEPGTWQLLWPALIALMLLSFSIIVFLIDARKWLLPLGAGFVVQSLGTLFFAFGELDRPSETLLWTFGAMLAVLAGMGLYYGVAWWRARRLEKEGILSDELAEEGVDPEELASMVTGRVGGDRTAAGGPARVIPPEDLERRQSVWWYLLLAAALLFLAETLVSNRLSRTVLSTE